MTMLSRMLVAAVAAVGVAALATGPATARAQSCGGGYASVSYGQPAPYYPSAYTTYALAPVYSYAPAPVVYSVPAYSYTYAAPVVYPSVSYYVSGPAYYSPPVVYRSYAPAPIYRGHSSFGFGYGGFSGHRGRVSVHGRR